MIYQIYTSTCCARSDSYIVPDNQLWDNQQLVYEANSIEAVSKHFKRNFRGYWKWNYPFIDMLRYEDGFPLCLDKDRGGLEIHCKSNQELILKPPRIHINSPQQVDGNMEFFVPRSRQIMRENARKRRRVCDPIAQKEIANKYSWFRKGKKDEGCICISSDED